MQSIKTLQHDAMRSEYVDDVYPWILFTAHVMDLNKWHGLGPNEWNEQQHWHVTFPDRMNESYSTSDSDSESESGTESFSTSDPDSDSSNHSTSGSLGAEEMINNENVILDKIIGSTSHVFFDQSNNFDYVNVKYGNNPSGLVPPMHSTSVWKPTFDDCKIFNQQMFWTKTSYQQFDFTQCLNAHL